MSHFFRSISVMPSAFAGGIVRSGLGRGGLGPMRETNVAHVTRDLAHVTNARDLARTYERTEGSR